MAEKEKTMKDSLSKYGDQSAQGLGRMVDALRSAASSVPPDVNKAAGVVSSFMPGYGLLTSRDIASEAGGLWRNGDYGEAMVKMSDAMFPAIEEISWLVPGGGFAKKAMK